MQWIVESRPSEASREPKWHNIHQDTHLADAGMSTVLRVCEVPDKKHSPLKLHFYPPTRHSSRGGGGGDGGPRHIWPKAKFRKK